ncbi:hypothetical protein D3C75_1329600 [compost metagenome]
MNDYFFADNAKTNAHNVFTASLDYWVNVKKQVESGTVDVDKFVTAKQIFDQE